MKSVCLLPGKGHQPTVKYEKKNNNVRCTLRTMCQNYISESHKPEAGSLTLESFILTAHLKEKLKARNSLGYFMKHFYSFTFFNTI